MYQESTDYSNLPANSDLNNKKKLISAEAIKTLKDAL